MSTPSRTANSAVIDKVVREPGDYSFLQIMRLLERACATAVPQASGTSPLGARTAVAGFTPPAREIVRLLGNHSLDFPQSEVEDLESKKGQWHLRLNHIGLTGATGVLPFHYTEFILTRLRQKDPALRDFLDLFNHRIASLYYDASIKYRLPQQYERRMRFSGKDSKPDRQTQALLSLVGMGTKHLAGRSVVRDESLLYYSGLLTAQVKTASGLKQLLQHYFGIPVAIDEFVSEWQELIPDVRTRLGSRQMPKGQNACLGRTVLLGRKGWFSQGKIGIRLGPLNYEQFSTFAPGTTALKALNDVVKMYVGSESDYGFTIQVQRQGFPRNIALGGKSKSLMGWNTWLSGSPKLSAGEDKHLNIHISAQRAQ